MTRMIDWPTEARVVSRDGTELAYWAVGDGPPVLLVHGATADHTRWGPILPHLSPYARVYAMDRRGRGASGDAPGYDAAREFEDVAAVVDAVAAACGASVDLYGHSFGGFCAFHAALLTPHIRRLVLYEGWPTVQPGARAFPPGVGERIDTLIANGDRETALETFMRDEVQVPEPELSAIRAQPSWQARVAAVHTVPREVRAFSARDAAFDADLAAKIEVPVLLLVGGDSPDLAKGDVDTVVDALPDARVVVIEGQQHLADVLVPDVFARHVLAFLRAEG